MSFLYKYFIFLLFFTINYLSAQDKYWIFFKDKPTLNSIVEIEKSFSEKSIQRRKIQNISWSETDLPLNLYYVSSIKSLGINILNTSKWLNAISSNLTESQIKKVVSLPFVSKVQKVLKFQNPYLNPISTKTQSFDYGNSLDQFQMMGIPYFHNQNFTGLGVLMGVFDPGFPQVNIEPGFSHLFSLNRIIKTRDFVTGDTLVFDDHFHGTSCLSNIVVLNNQVMVGGSPDVNLVLARTENANSESLVEEDNWVRASEWADSLGVEIISSSLGYNLFDGGIGNYTWADLDGRTAPISIAATIAASKGILVVTAAGNEGNNSWRKIIVPGDADSVLTVGGVDYNKNHSSFSSEGNTVDGRIKPDVCAVASSAAIFYPGSGYTFSNGTSFATPQIAAFAACLKQKYPSATVMQLITAIRNSAHMAANPDSIFGWGVPNAKIADSLLLQLTSISNSSNNNIQIYPNPTTDFITILNKNDDFSKVNIYDLNGKLILTSGLIANFENKLNISDLNSGIYLVKFLGKREFNTKIIKE